MTDILIIGGGPAGLTAAIYAARAGKTVTLCEKEGMGGQITHAHLVSNYPGIPEVAGTDLSDRLCAQAMDMGTEVEFTAVTRLSRREDGTFLAETEDGELTARTVIFAGGARPRPLAVEGETRFVGNGVSYCALCDGAFFAGQDVAVVGGGSSALSDALFLAGICRSVTLIHRRDGFRAEPVLVERARKMENIRILTGCTVKTLEGGDRLEGLTLEHRDGKTSAVAVSAIFVALGRVPECSLIADLTRLDENGYAIATEDCGADAPGLYVAGDCRRKSVRQLTTAVADGTVAATAACAFLG